MKNQSISDFVAAQMDAVLNSDEHKSLFSSQYKTAQTMADKMCAKCGSKHGDKDSCMADDNDARKAKKESKESDSKDSSSASDMNDAKKKKDSKESSDSSSADDDNDARKKKKSEESSDSSSADDNDHYGAMGSDPPGDRDHGEYDDHFADDNDAKKKKKSEESSDSSSADDNDAGTDIRELMKQQSGPGHTPLVNPMSPSVAFDVAIDSLLTASAALDSVGLGRGSALTLKIASLVVEAKKKDKKSKKDSKKDSKKSDSQSAKDKKSKDSKKDDKKKSDSHSAKDKKSDSKSSKDSKKSSK